MDKMLYPLIVVCCASQAFSADEFRKLSDTTGNTIEARVVSVNGDQVTIQRRDKREFTLPISRFAPADQDYIRSTQLGSGGVPKIEVAQNLKGEFTEAWRVAAPIEIIQFTADGQHLIGSGAKTVKLNAATGEILWQADQTGMVAVGGAGPAIGLVTKAGLTLLDPETGSVTLKAPAVEPLSDPNDFAVSPLGNLAAFTSGSQQKVYLYKLPSGESVPSLPMGRAAAESVAFSPDGKMLAASDWQEGILFFDAQTFKKVDEFRDDPKDRRLIKHLSFSPDGKQLAFHKSTPGPRAEVWVWDIASKKPVQMFQSQVGASGSVAFSPNGKWLAAKHMPGGARTVIRVWDIAAGTEMTSLGDEKMSGSTAFDFSPDGRMLVCACKYDGADSAIAWRIE